MFNKKVYTMTKLKELSKDQEKIEKSCQTSSFPEKQINKSRFYFNLSDES